MGLLNEAFVESNMSKKANRRIKPTIPIIGWGNAEAARRQFSLANYARATEDIIHKAVNMPEPSLWARFWTFLRKRL